ncbi:hypothetical protein Tco_0997920 [Tanacetum coccineum]
MGDENPICTIGDYSKPSHEGYRNTIKLPVGNNVAPLRSDTIRLVQNGCSFHGLWSEDPNQHLKDFLKLLAIGLNVFQQDPSPHRRILLPDSLLSSFHWEGPQNSVPHHGIDLWLQVQIFYDHVNPFTRRTIDQSVGGKLRDLNAEESWALLEDLALYDNESWNDTRDFAKPVKAIALPQDVPRKEREKEQGNEENEMETDMEVDEVIKEEESEFETDEEIKEILEEEDDEDGENFNLFPTMEELTHHEWKLKNHRPPWVKARIRAGSPNNIKISCIVGHLLKHSSYKVVPPPVDVDFDDHGV